MQDDPFTVTKRICFLQHAGQRVNYYEMYSMAAAPDACCVPSVDIYD